MKSVGVILPTTGAKVLIEAIESVLNQSYKNTYLYLVVDGKEYVNGVRRILSKIKSTNKDRLLFYPLPQNVGKNGFYGHRVYSSLPAIMNTDYVMFLDQDCWYDTDHIESMVSSIQKNDELASFSLRKILSNKGDFLCNDDCESLGFYKPIFDYYLIDTNCYIINRRLAIMAASAWYGGIGQDRVFYSAISNFCKLNCNYKYSVNYRLGGNDNSVTYNFFSHWNKVVLDKYNNNLPWRNNL